MIDSNAPLTFPVSWEQFHRDAKALAWRLLELRLSFKGIAGIARGGLIPAAIVARELDMRHVETICISSYEDQAQQEAKIIKMLEGSGEGWLIVDDLADTGNTARIVRHHLPKCHLATVYAKPAGKPLVDTFFTEVSQETWIDFPWDLELKFAQPLSGVKRQAANG